MQFLFSRENDEPWGIAKGTGGTQSKLQTEPQTR